MGGAAALVLAEAAWFSLVLDALANGTAGPSRPAVDLPFVAIALAGVAAAVLAAVLRRWAWTLLVAVVAAAVTTELIAGLTPGVAMFAAPGGPVAVRATTWAAVAAALAWGRGTWLGLVPPSVNQAAVSMVVGWAVVLDILVQRAIRHSAAFERATSAAGWVLVVFFLAVSTAYGWTQVHSLERVVSRRPAAAGPGGAWLAVVAAPLALVSAVAFLLGAATSVFPAVAGAARDVARALNVAGIWLFARLFDLFAHHHFRLHRIAIQGPPAVGAGHPARRSSLIVNVLAAVPELLVALGLLALLVFLATLVVRRLRRRLPVKRPDEERTSIFSWSHLWAQVRAVLGRWRGGLARWRQRRRRGPDVPGGTLPVPAAAAEEPADPVRAAYRRFLWAAEAASVGRDPAETPRELAGRLTLDRRPLGTLTGAYERARYGEREEPGSEAAEAAEALALELSRRSPEGASPAPS